MAVRTVTSTGMLYIYYIAAVTAAAVLSRSRTRGPRHLDVISYIMRCTKTAIIGCMTVGTTGRGVLDMACCITIGCIPQRTVGRCCNMAVVAVAIMGD